MKALALAAALLFVGVASFGQAGSSQYQPAHIMAAQLRQPAPGEDPNVVRYNVTLTVGNTEYVVLYTPTKGDMGVEYKLGRDGNVLVDNDTIKYNDIAGRPHEVPILSRRTMPPARVLGKCGFDTNNGSRLDRECKSSLDEIVARSQQQPCTSLIVVGFSTPKEYADTAASRAMTVKSYLMSATGTVGWRGGNIIARTGKPGERAVAFYCVEPGSYFDLDDTALVYEGQVKGAAHKYRP